MLNRPSMGPGCEGSAGFSGYVHQTQRTFESTFCTEPEIAASQGNPSLVLSFLFNHYRAARANPLGHRRIADTRSGGKSRSLKSRLGRFHITFLNFSAGEGKNPTCKAARPLALQ